MGCPSGILLLAWAWRATALGAIMDHHNPNWHSMADDRPDSREWPWYSDLTDGTHSSWGLHTVKKFDNINLSAMDDHPGFIRRIINKFIDG
jgi:hypothetical protein